jgi:hypothetical protein
MARNDEEAPITAARLFSGPATDTEIRMLLERALDAPDVELPDDVRHELRERLDAEESASRIADWLVARMGWGDEF